jgi:hypothetical protein
MCIGLRNSSAQRIKHTIGGMKNRPGENLLFFREKLEENPDGTKTRSQKPEARRGRRQFRALMGWRGIQQKQTKVTKRASEPA